MNRRKIVVNILIIIAGIIAMWLVISHIAHFSYPDYFYRANPDIDIYVGVNVVSRWADFSFFTYLTMLQFGIWCMLLGLSKLFGWQRLINFTTNINVVCFVFCNYVITTTLYTVFELLSGMTFGWYANVPLSWHNVATNILAHYVLFVVATVIFSKITTSGVVRKTSYIYSSVYLLIYYLIVKLVGEFAYNIRWFPYIIFDAKSFGSSLGIQSYGWSVVMLVLCCAVVLVLYQLLNLVCLRAKSKKHGKEAVLLDFK